MRPVRLAAALFAFISAAPAAAADDAVLQLMHHVNQQRLSHGLKPLAPSDRLSAAAQGHAEAMARGDCFAHACPGGPSLTDRLARAGYAYRMAAENIAAGMDSAEAVVQSWMASDGHRRNILHAEAVELGAGYVLLEQDDGEARYRHYWTVTFGRRF